MNETPKRKLFLGEIIVEQKDISNQHTDIHIVRKSFTFVYKLIVRFIIQPVRKCWELIGTFRSQNTPICLSLGMHELPIVGLPFQYRPQYFQSSISFEMIGYLHITYT